MWARQAGLSTIRRSIRVAMAAYSAMQLQSKKPIAGGHDRTRKPTSPLSFVCCFVFGTPRLTTDLQLAHGVLNSDHVPLRQTASTRKTALMPLFFRACQTASRLLHDTTVEARSQNDWNPDEWVTLSRSSCATGSEVKGKAPFTSAACVPGGEGLGGIGDEVVHTKLRGTWWVVVCRGFGGLVRSDQG